MKFRRKLSHILSGRTSDAGPKPKPFVHVLATRIGIGVYDQAWFDYRLRLFESITVPSMKAQTCQDFSWLLIVDREMPAKAREQLDQAIAGMSNAKIVAVEFKTDLKATVVRWSKRRAVAKGVEYVMTSRLDDDDAMRVDAFERLHREAAEFIRVDNYHYAVFSFNLGCMWLPSRRLGYTRYHDSHSLALSLVEPVESCKCVYAYPHRDIKRVIAPRGAYIRGIDGDTLWWLYAAHNLASSDTGDGKRAEKITEHKYGYDVDDSLLATFGLDPETIAALATVPDPSARKPVLRMWAGAMDIEREIRQTRSEMAQAVGREQAALKERLEELELERRAAGSGIVETGGS